MANIVISLFSLWKLLAPLVLIMLAEIEARDTECGAAINGPVTLSSARTRGCHPQTKTGNTRMIFYQQRDLGIVIMGRAMITLSLTMEYYIAITEAQADRCHRDQAQESHGVIPALCLYSWFPPRPQMGQSCQVTWRRDVSDNNDAIMTIIVRRNLRRMRRQQRMLSWIHGERGETDNNESLNKSWHQCTHVKFKILPRFADISCLSRCLISNVHLSIITWCPVPGVG